MGSHRARRAESGSRHDTGSTRLPEPARHTLFAGSAASTRPRRTRNARFLRASPALLRPGLANAGRIERRMKHRLAIIGTGRSVSNHLTAVRALADRVDLVAAVDVNTARLAAICEANGIPHQYG